MKTSVIAAIGVGLAALLSGCVNWASYPANPGEVAIKDPNTPSMEEIMMAGLSWTVRKYPPVSATGEHTGQGRLAINLPPGVKPKVYRRVAEAAGGGAEPITEANKDLPVYHVKSVRVRGDEGQINIIWPATTLGQSPQGGPIWQEVKLGLHGGLSAWHVTSFREWGPGGSEPPPLNFYVKEEDLPPPGKSTEKPKKLPGGP
jgi:hypothetical protein